MLEEESNKTPSKVKAFDVIKSIKDERLFYVFIAIGVITLSLLAIINNISKRYTVATPATGGVYKELISDDILSLTPILASNSSEKAISSLIYAPLLNKKNTGEIELVLAKDVSISDDGLEITIDISPYAKFSDGSRVLSDDILYTYELYSKFGDDDNIRNIISAVDVKKITDSQILISRKTNNNLVYQLLELGIIKKANFENLSDSDISRDPVNFEAVGAGPYKVTKHLETSLSKLDQIDLFENNYYYKLGKDRPYIRSLEFKYIENKTAIATELNSKDNEYVYYTADKSFVKNINSTSTSVSTINIPRTYAIYINQAKSTVLSNKDLRAIISAKINRDDIIQNVLGYNAIPSYNPISFDTESTTNTADLTKLSSSTNATITISTLNTEELIKVCERIKSQLAPIGINIEIKAYDKDELISKVVNGRDFEMLLFATEIKDIDMLYPLWHSSFRKPPGSNISGYLSTTLDKNLELLISATNTQSTSDLYKNIKEEINSEYAWIPLYSTTVTKFSPKGLQTLSTTNYMSGLDDRLSGLSKYYNNTELLWSQNKEQKTSELKEKIYNFIH